MEVSPGNHLIHALTQRHVRFEHVVQNICSQFLHISMGGNSYNLLGLLTPCIISLLWKTHLLQSHGNFVWLVITSSHCTSGNGPFIPATKKQEVEDSDHILLQSSLQSLMLNGLQASLVLCLLRSPELQTVLQPQHHNSETKGNNHFPRPVSCLLVKATQDVLPTRILCKHFKNRLTLWTP